ncbi:hypothetical protein PCANC_05315 [Puccinia coronata f. sp. avenae]|uniref:Phosphatidate phosphatase APP1 catalytic domain-containing protein n=1 Tax=Puccinia coronata f. sp. avenae TaxID=200324 RepID=A0A2N5VYR5_9BASI|nr:hypothetical protein PCANC_05315 [Puccinia coronata f. sp. avenae]
MNNNTNETTSKRQLITSKAITLSSKILTKSANYLTSKDLDALANPISRVNGIVSKATNPATQHHHQPPPHSPSRNRSANSWQAWDKDASNWNMVVGGQPVTNSTERNTQSTSSSSSGYLSYFHPQNWQKKNKESIYTEDHLVCFPGFVALRSPSHSRAGDIELFISLHAFRARSTLENMNRSQRLVHSMICKMTGLPPLSASTTPGATLVESSMQNSVLIEEELMKWDEEQDDKMRKFEPLLPSSNPTTQSPFTHQAAPPLHTLNTQLTTQPAQIICTVPTPIQPNASNNPFATVSRSSSTSSTRSYRRILQHEETQSDELLDTGMGRLLEKFHIENEDLHALHFNLKERLHSFFSQKAESSKIRLKLYGICSSKATRSSTSKSLFQSRTEAPNLLSPGLDSTEFIINGGRPLLTQIITTKPGGVWSDKLVLPWQTIETHLRVHQMQQKANEPMTHLTPSSTSQSPDTGIIRLRIEAELVKDELNDPASRPSKSTADPPKKDPVRKLSVAKSSLVMELDVIPAMAESVHVISDIDDTIKHTNVLGGLKCVFKNVFLAGFDQVAIAGMAEWYQSLQCLGCWMHYISNSPLELWYCIEGFLAANGFPRGSTSLKEYARGATSILSGMWESAGSRKRARVESIIKQFPNAKFICVGDSGEQDLEMYVSLAQAYPGSIISIYIRDVTTPAILGKDISLDQLCTTTERGVWSEWDDPMKTPTQKRSSLVCTSRANSPATRSFPPIPAYPPEDSSRPHRSKSHDILSQPDRTVLAAPPSKRASQRPLAPPKPLHLSSKPASAKPVGDGHTKRHSQIERIQRQTGDLSDASKRSPRSKSVDLASTPPPPLPLPPAAEGYFALPKGGTPSATPPSYAKPAVPPPAAAAAPLDDGKTQLLLDAFRARVARAQAELRQLHLVPPDPPSADPLSRPDPLNNKIHVAFGATKLRLFRSGFDDCIPESLVDVKKFINK